MNRRLVLIDEEVVNPNQFYGIGLGNEIYPYSYLESLPELEVNKILTVGPGDGVLIVGKRPYDKLRERYHYGIRNENIYDVSLLSRLSIEGGAFIKVLHKSSDLPFKINQGDINYFMSSTFTEVRDLSYFKQVVAHTYKDALPFLKFFYDSEEELGFDYETSGLSDVPGDFYITGASLCNWQYGCFFSFTDIEESCTKDEWSDFKSKFAAILVKNQSRLWAYNLQFEQQVSWREFGVDLELCDASVYNIIAAYHDKKRSLKWAGQMFCQVNAWDTDFDYLNEWIDKMYYDIIPDPNDKKRTIKVFKCTVDNFQETEEFKKIVSRYPAYKDQFIHLITKYFGNSFMNIPSDILGYYCNYDAMITLLIRLDMKGKYTETCVQTYLDNLRLGARLHSGGMYKDEEYRLKYEIECHKMMSYGITYVATVYCKFKMDDLSNNINSLSLYNSNCISLLSRGEFYGGDLAKMAKMLVVNNLSGCYDSGLDEGSVLMKYGTDILEALISGLAVTGSIADRNIGRKKKVFAPIIENLSKVLNYDSLPLGELEYIEKYLFYKHAYEAFIEVWNNQMPDIYHIPDRFIFMGNAYKSEDYHEYIKETYFNCTSPKDYPVIVHYFIEKFKYETVFLTTIYQNKNKLPDQEKYYINQGINTIEDAYKHFMNNISIYPEDIKKEAAMYMNDLYNENMESTFDAFTGFWKQADFMPELREKFDTLSTPYSDSDVLDTFTFMRKFCIMTMLYKKYCKVMSTYIGGLFIDNDRTVIDTNILLPIRKAKPGEPGAVTKMYPKFMVCEKSTKRWSSPYHTIIAHSDIKRIVAAPKGFLLSYFDIRISVA